MKQMQQELHLVLVIKATKRRVLHHQQILWTCLWVAKTVVRLCRLYHLRLLWTKEVSITHHLQQHRVARSKMPVVTRMFRGKHQLWRLISNWLSSRITRFKPITRPVEAIQVSVHPSKGWSRESCPLRSSIWVRESLRLTLRQSRHRTICTTIQHPQIKMINRLVSSERL